MIIVVRVDIVKRTNFPNNNIYYRFFVGRSSYDKNNNHINGYSVADYGVREVLGTIINNHLQSLTLNYSGKNKNQLFSALKKNINIKTLLEKINVFILIPTSGNEQGVTY